jgi:predicted transcriptional regulator of viral defense system
MIIFAIDIMNAGKLSVRNYIDQLQSKGRYTFLKSDLTKSPGLSTAAIELSLNRLLKKHRIAMIRQGFYIIVPLEYQPNGILPASWFIHQLMEYLELPYYVALLSAAAIHGAAHQKSQEFQVITNKSLRTIHARGLRIRFFKKTDLDMEVGLEQIKTENGYINTSVPERTALDLIQYVRQIGGLNRAATVLEELAEKIDSTRLLKNAQKEKSLCFIQRLGFIMDLLGFENLTKKLRGWLEEKKPPKTLLDPALPINTETFNPKWRLYVNSDIDTDFS